MLPSRQARPFAGAGSFIEYQGATPTFGNLDKLLFFRFFFIGPQLRSALSSHDWSRHSQLRFSSLNVFTMGLSPAKVRPYGAHTKRGGVNRPLKA
jgi:hypothetical protein